MKENENQKPYTLIFFSLHFFCCCCCAGWRNWINRHNINGKGTRTSGKMAFGIGTLDERYDFNANLQCNWWLYNKSIRRVDFAVAHSMCKQLHNVMFSIFDSFFYLNFSNIFYIVFSFFLIYFLKVHTIFLMNTTNSIDAALSSTNIKSSLNEISCRCEIEVCIKYYNIHIRIYTFVLV